MTKQELVENQEHTPPPCPGCGKPLDSVEVQDYDLWTFDPETGTYERSTTQTSLDYNCSKCNHGVLFMFPDGIVNYPYTVIGTLSGGIEIMGEAEEGLGAFSTPLCDECKDGTRCQVMCAETLLKGLKLFDIERGL